MKLKTLPILFLGGNLGIFDERYLFEPFFTGIFFEKRGHLGIGFDLSIYTFRIKYMPQV